MLSLQESVASARMSSLANINNVSVKKEAERTGAVICEMVKRMANTCRAFVFSSFRPPPLLLLRPRFCISLRWIYERDVYPFSSHLSAILFFSLSLFLSTVSIRSSRVSPLASHARVLSLSLSLSISFSFYLA